MNATLDQTLIDEAAPPGSLRYFALLYTPNEQRQYLAALFIIDSEIRTSARLPSHDVAHTRLQWWRDEISRLAAGNPQHPATKTLGALRATQDLEFKSLHEMLVAAEQDLACTTYDDDLELLAYQRRSLGIVGEMAARILLAPERLSAETKEAVRQLGVAMRQTEILRDIRQDAHEGRIFFVLATLEKCHVQARDLDQPRMPGGLRPLLLETIERTRIQLTARTNGLSAAERTRLRPLMVLASLHVRLLARLQRELDAAFSKRIDLASFEKVWTAWRTARRAQV